MCQSQFSPRFSFLFKILTSVRRIALDVHVTCDADETASFDGIPSVVGAPASLFRLVLSEVCGGKPKNCTICVKIGLFASIINGSNLKVLNPSANENGF